MIIYITMSYKYTIAFNSITICSYNCKNLKSYVAEIRSLCDNCDILLLQETWLHEQELSSLAGVHPDFYGRGISSMDLTVCIFRGRPYGGLAILWRKSLGSLCSTSPMNDSRMMALDINILGTKVSILNVYLPYDDGVNIDSYRSYLAKIDVQIGDSYYACAIGDFNANISSNNHRFGKELLENLILSDQLLASVDTFTFTSDAQGSTVWLDHIVSSKNLHVIINKVWVDYDFISSDHFPMFMKINTNTVNISKEPTNKEKHVTKHINWSKASEEDLLAYTRNTEKLISEIKLEHGLLLCDDVNCQDPAHHCAINRLYNDVTDALQTAGSFLLEKKKSTIQANTWLERLVRRTAP